jgi:hypothetical protein
VTNFGQHSDTGNYWQGMNWNDANVRVISKACQKVKVCLVNGLHLIMRDHDGNVFVLSGKSIS